MKYTERITQAENEIQRFIAKRGSEFARPVDMTNLVNAIEKLRTLKNEAQQFIEVEG